MKKRTMNLRAKRPFRFYFRCFLALPIVFAFYLAGCVFAVLPPVGILLILAPFMLAGNGFVYLLTDDAQKRKHCRVEIMNLLNMLLGLISFPLRYVRDFILDNP